MNLAEALRLIFADLDSLRVRSAVVGGLAVSSHVEPRTTRDVDVAVSVASDAEAENVVHQLLRRGYQLVGQLEQTTTGRLSTVRLRPPRTSEVGPIVDLLFASSGLEPELVAVAEVLEVVPGLRVPVARKEHLIALKVLSHDDTRRPLDRVDFLNLVRESSPGEIEAAKEALRRIEALGFHRNQDLLAKFVSMQGIPGA